jgi:hypothetical protein
LLSEGGITLNKREWLVSQGLAQPGRGRFSREALAALEASGLKFDTTSSITGDTIEFKQEPEAPPATVSMAPPINVPPIERDEYTRKGLDDKGHVIEWATCHRCNSHIMYCHCPNGPKAPRYVVKDLDTAPAN